MRQFLSFILELLRIILFMAILLAVLGWAERFVSQLIIGEARYHWLMMFGNLILFFIFYRNKLQFTGWYRSSRNKKLNRFTTKGLLLLAISMIVISPVLHP